MTARCAHPMRPATPPLNGLCYSRPAVTNPNVGGIRRISQILRSSFNFFHVLNNTTYRISLVVVLCTGRFACSIRAPAPTRVRAFQPSSLKEDTLMLREWHRHPDMGCCRRCPARECARRLPPMPPAARAASACRPGMWRPRWQRAPRTRAPGWANGPPRTRAGRCRAARRAVA